MHTKTLFIYGNKGEWGNEDGLRKRSSKKGNEGTAIFFGSNFFEGEKSGKKKGWRKIRSKRCGSKP